MTERVKVRSITFLACVIAIATAFVLSEGSGWQKKRARVRGEMEGERDFGLLPSLGKVLPITLTAKPRPWGFKQSRSRKSKNEQLLNVLVHSLHILERRRGAVLAHTDRGSHPGTHSMCMITLHKTVCTPAEGSCGCETPLKGHRLKKKGV